jgi:hypothetical protein
MQKHVLMLTTSAFILACGAIAASAQQGPMMGQPPRNRSRSAITTGVEEPWAPA